MPKRNFRIVKRIANIPVLGICEYCNAQFKSNQRTVDGAEGELRIQFNAHKCKRLDASQNAVRVVREATEGE